MFQALLFLSLLIYVVSKDLLSPSEMEELKKQLLSVAGVYQDPKLVEKYQLQRTVLVTGCNHGFLNHLYNFDCFMRRLGMRYLVITMDKSAEDVLKKTHPHITTFPMIGDNEITSSATEFRSKQFNLITARKKAAVHSIMQLGFDVLFSDTDVALLRDPFPYLVWKNVDYVHSLNIYCDDATKYDNFLKQRNEGNTGFYFVRSTNSTLRLWAEAFHAAPRHPRLDDQAIFWKVVRSIKSPVVTSIGRCHDVNRAVKREEEIVSCILDACVFSSGMLSRLYVPEFTYEKLQEYLSKRGETAVAIHANYLSGNSKKAQRLSEHHLWLAEREEGDRYRCRPYDPLPRNWTYPEIKDDNKNDGGGKL